MKNKLFISLLCIVFSAEIIVLAVFAFQTTDLSQDTVAVNEIVKTLEKDFNNIDSHINSTALDYVVIDIQEDIIYKTRDGLSEDINRAIAHRDSILDIEIDNAIVGKVIIYNNSGNLIQTKKQTIVLFISAAIFLTLCLCTAYAVYVYFVIIKPFRKLEGFALRIAGGNLDIPLEMDRHNLFGAFTESFDIMRSELKKAQISQARANASKKELVAKLSHDIKTPIASIKALSEVGLAVCTKSEDRANYTRIIIKADQINTLVSNLFTATLEELQQLTVSPTVIYSKQIKKLLENADYLHRAVIPDIPEYKLYADSLRLQQVFDNIFANSYKYAATDIIVKLKVIGEYICIVIEDFGGGVTNEELLLIKEKFKRGKNAVNTEGAGLGLYISDYFMKEMKGELTVENGKNGLKITVKLMIVFNN